MKVSAPPHVGRLLQRIETLDAPAVQLWAWPGSGQQAVLDALVAAGRQVAQPVSLDDLADRDRLREVVEIAATAGARWLVLPAVPAPPRAAASALATLLPAGKRLVFSAWERRLADPVSTAWIDPIDHLLTAEEVAALWSLSTGREPGSALVESLLAATDGWYRPLALLAERAAVGGLEAGVLPRLRGVESFLRHEVIGRLTADERSVLYRLALAERIRPEEWRDRLDRGERAIFERLVSELGLLLPVAAAAGEPPAEARLPNLVRHYLRRQLEDAREEAAAGFSAGDLKHQLAAAELARRRPAAALAIVESAAGGEPDGELAALRERIHRDDWPRLLVAMPRRRLAAGLPDVPHPPPAVRLLREAVALSTAGAGGDLAGLQQLAVMPGDGEDRAVATAATLCLALIQPSGSWPVPVVSSLPAELGPLVRLAEALARAGEVAASAAGEDEAEEAAVAVARALAALDPPTRVRTVDLLGDGSVGAGDAVASGLAQAALQRLRRLAPEVAAALSASPDLVAGWRRWIERRPAAGAAGPWRGYELRLLGEGRAWRQGEDGEVTERSWPLKRAFKALAFLATEPGFAASRAALERALWPREEAEVEGLPGSVAEEDAGGGVERNFHPTLSHLRRGLLAGLPRKQSSGGGAGWPPPLLHRDGIYRLNPALDWRVDSSELERLQAIGQEEFDLERTESAVRHWERARRLYAAPFLAGYDDAWIVDRRERYQRVFLDLQRSLGETYTRVGRLEDAMDALRTVLIADPLQERVHRALMHVYSRQGRRDLVRRQYDRLTDLLSRELSVAPQRETTDVYHRLMG